MPAAHFQTSDDFAVAQTDQELQAAPGLRASLVVESVVISNGAVAGNLTLLAGAAGAVLLELYLGVEQTVQLAGLDLRVPANTALVLTSTTVTTHAVNVVGRILSRS